MHADPVDSRREGWHKTWAVGSHGPGAECAKAADRRGRGTSGDRPTRCVVSLSLPVSWACAATLSVCRGPTFTCPGSPWVNPSSSVGGRSCTEPVSSHTPKWRWHRPVFRSDLPRPSTSWPPPDRTVAGITPLSRSGITVGRGDVDLSLHDDTLSRRHARISVESGHLKLVDLGSTNGSTISNDPGTDSTGITVDDRIKLATA